MSILKALTKDIVERDVSAESASLVNKWEQTGLLEGLDDGPGQNNKSNMARLLENQATELLRETSAMASADVEGFSAVAFPIVRRVFGDLIANELVSVQPMSLPSGLIFFLDFQAGTQKHVGLNLNDSVFGGNVVGAQLTGGVDLVTNGGGGFYNLNNGYSSPTGSVASVRLTTADAGIADQNLQYAKVGMDPKETVTLNGNTFDIDRLVQYDPDISSGSQVAVVTIATSRFPQFNYRNATTITDVSSGSHHADWATPADDTVAHSGTLLRRLTQVINPLHTAEELSTAVSTGQGTSALLIYDVPEVGDFGVTLTGSANKQFNFAITDDFQNSNALGSVIGDPTWGLEFGSSTPSLTAGQNAQIPEIDVKVDSIDIRAVTRKLKARWTPELSQDLNAYHNIDAEVELTSILSEQIALEIDQEILQDLVKHATAGVMHWSRRPGKFLNRETGADISTVANESLLGADFTGNVSEWYETLLETINDVSAQIHRKTLRGGANFIVVSPEVANLLEFTAGFRGAVTHDDSKGTTGAVKVGSLSKKFDVYVNPYFYRQVVLVGRKGSSFLESGYVYAPYVPLQTTPLIYDPDTFVPNKGVMTRYAKKMVRPDMYGLVVVHDLLG